MELTQFHPPVTTGSKASPADLRRAQALASYYRLPFLRRGAESLESLLENHRALFVWARNGLTLWSSKNEPLRWTPGMAGLRLKRYGAGERDDVFLRHAELLAGESVLDCTLGFGQDALMAAQAVGPRGKVVGVEHSFPLYVLTSEGLREHGTQRAAAAEIQTVHGEASDYLKAQPSRSFDVVVFDPMFERPRKAQPQFEALRSFAQYALLAPETLAEARRVARRRVLVKASRYSPTLKRLGLMPERASRSSPVVWARVPPLAFSENQGP